MTQVLVSGIFDDLRSPQVRFLEEAAKLGELRLLLWSDETARQITGQAPKFSLPERRYFLEALRFVSSVQEINDLANPHSLPAMEGQSGAIWAIPEAENSPEKRRFCQQAGLELRPIPESQLAGFPVSLPAELPSSGRKKVIITGSFDWLHTGHVRFFEEVSTYGDLVAVVGHDANIQLLKGEGHPLFKEDERLYMVQAIRYVSQAMLSTGHGWLDAEPELERLKPDIYAVNEDGDKPEKREYCAAHGIHYLVLKRAPKEGLAARSSTALRGF